MLITKNQGFVNESTASRAALLSRRLTCRLMGWMNHSGQGKNPGGET
jgi:hypothetical protein